MIYYGWVTDMVKHIITEQEYKEVKELAKSARLKRVERRLRVVTLRYEGLKDTETGGILGYSRQTVSLLCGEFKRAGAKEYARHKYGGNAQAVDTAKEKGILDSFRAKAEAGQQITAVDIKKAFDEYRGKDTGRGYIYMLLKRHNRRMVTPGGKPPEKASGAEIEASKKLTLDTRR